MNIDDMVGTARDAITVRRVFAEPYTHEGTTVIAAARVLGGGGGGGGRDAQDQGGDGGGFGVAARPVGAFVIKDGDVRWVPAVDVTRIVGIAGAVTIAAVLSRARVARLRTRRRAG